MQSRISIDVNEDNQPVIFIQYIDSSDVRDKLVRRFMQGFGSESNFARIEFIQHPSLEINSKMIITPISEVIVAYDNEGIVNTREGDIKVSRKISTVIETNDFK